MMLNAIFVSVKKDIQKFANITETSEDVNLQQVANINMKLERKLEELKQNRMGNDNDNLAEKVDEKVGDFEKKLNNQRKELDEKNAKNYQFGIKAG